MVPPEFYFAKFHERPITVHVTDSAVMHLVLSAVESYRVRNWGNNVFSNCGSVETAGLLLGTRTRDSVQLVVRQSRGDQR